MNIVRCTILLAMLVWLCLPAAAQDDQRVLRERQALRRSQQALKQSEEQRTALLSEKEALIKEKSAAETALKRALAKLKAQRRAEKAREAQFRSDLEVARKAIESEKLATKMAEDRSAELLRNLTKTQAALDDRSHTLEAVRNLLERSTQSNTVAQDRNRALYKLCLDLIEQVRNRTHTEPVLGLSRVDLENWAEDYRDRVDAQRLVPSP